MKSVSTMAEEMFKVCLEYGVEEKIIGDNSALDLAKWLVRTNLLDQCPVCGAFIGVNIDCKCCEIYTIIERELEE